MNFSLKAFGVADPAFPFSLTGSVVRNMGIFRIRYVLRGPLEELVIPDRGNKRSREHALWNSTCFEFFLAGTGSPGYLEFNLSPSGSWNVYRFESYRLGMTEEEAFASLPFEITRAPGLLALSLTLDLNIVRWSGGSLDLAISAITRGRDDTVAYWALHHPGSRPDFHRRDGFVSRLSA